VTVAAAAVMGMLFRRPSADELARSEMPDAVRR
jgi:hypothetical protein